MKKLCIEFKSYKYCLVETGSSFSRSFEPLIKAERAGIPYLIIYLFEPSRIEYPDTSQRHLQFVYHSIGNLNKVLSEFNRRVELFYGEAVDVFKYLIKDFRYNFCVQLPRKWNTSLLGTR